MQDFLILELQDGSLKYLYSGLDKNNPEILDYGLLGFDNRRWEDLFINFESKLNDIITNKLPPVKQLETYLIFPFESVIPVNLRYPDDEPEFKREQLNWELHKFLVDSPQDYLAEYYQGDRDLRNSLVEHNGLSVRREYIVRINKFLQSNSMFLAGIIFPQTLILNLFDNMDLPYNPVVLYKDFDSYNLFTSKPDTFPECSRFIFRTASEDKFDRPALTKMIDSLAIGQFSRYRPGGGKIYCFEKNLSDDEIEFIGMESKLDIKFVNGAKEPGGYQDDLADYFLLSLAHKKIGQLNFTV